MAYEPETTLATLAALRHPQDGGPTQVLFNQRHQIYHLDEEADEATRYRSLLEELAGSRGPVRVTLDSRRARVLEVATPTDEEIKAFEDRREPLEDPEETFHLDLEEVDPTQFNVVEHVLDLPIFRLCKEIIPSYAKAKEIFDFCAAQSCHLGGSTTVTPCIPFQYVRDGCYARAHKMRKIITERYGFCCEKVFSFANQNLDDLAVQANKWGGCCVQWWYHVAPLVRVKVKLGKLSVVLAMVIDPGMFDKPVLLTSWLYAQANTLCSPNAKVSMYSIQPGTAYWPDNYAGTAFDTDPGYVHTDQTLINYQSLVTC